MRSAMTRTQGRYLGRFTAVEMKAVCGGRVGDFAIVYGTDYEWTMVWHPDLNGAKPWAGRGSTGAAGAPILGTAFIGVETQVSMSNGSVVNLAGLGANPAVAPFAGDYEAAIVFGYVAGAGTTNAGMNLYASSLGGGNTGSGPGENPGGAGVYRVPGSYTVINAHRTEVNAGATFQAQFSTDGAASTIHGVIAQIRPRAVAF